MLSSEGEVLYVGKSKRVRSRLMSYFRCEYPEDKGARILRSAESIEWDYTPSEFAALLQELRLIKRFRPRYNVAMMRDARHYSFIKLTKGVAPKLLVVRGASGEEAGIYYGPFVGAQRVGEAVRELNDALMLRDCRTDMKMFYSDQGELFQLLPRTPGCIRHEISKCLGPCFVYTVPGHDGEDKVYLIRRGVVRAEVTKPKSSKDRRTMKQLVEDIFSQQESLTAQVPTHEIDELLLLSSWFRRFPKEMKRTRQVS